MQPSFSYPSLVIFFNCSSGKVLVFVLLCFLLCREVLTRFNLNVSPSHPPRPVSLIWSISPGCTTGTPAHTPDRPSATFAERRCQVSPPTACPVKARRHMHTHTASVFLRSLI